MLIEAQHIKFILDPNDTILGSIHQRLISDFEDPIKLEHFKMLLINNQNTAFIEYCNLENIDISTI